MPERPRETTGEMSLHKRILLGMGIGVAAGLALHFSMPPESLLFKDVVWWLDLLGKDLFIGGLKMIIAPLIFSTIIAGIGSLPGSGELGSIGVKTLTYYVCTTTIAVFIGIVAVLVIQPGAKQGAQRVRAQKEATLLAYRDRFQTETGHDPLASEHAEAYRRFVAEREGNALATTEFGSNWSRIKSTEDIGVGEMLRQQILQPVLSNPFTSLASSPPNALGIIFFAILVGLAGLALGERAAPVMQFFSAFSEVMMKITLWVMNIAPLAIGCLIASLLATLGFDAMRALAWYCATIILGIAVHTGVLLTLVRVFGGMPVREFVRGILDAWLIGFTTTSSAATLPITLHCVTRKLKVSPKVADFSLPVGATVNMDGTALYEGVAVIFLIQMFGGLDDVPVVMSFAKTLVIFVTAVFASVGAAAVPSAGLITMAIVAGAIGLPLHYIVIIYAVDHFLDMFRTATNLLGDAVGAVIVNRMERHRLGDAETSA